ncbi:N-acetylmuramoyl-L-alanine amidase [Clostridium sp. ATCC 25772]|uniref:N-acetylmuramoyl-L-alanine amidase n=1 Tax=Clostridium sp. ATCC 25772 TaxID=1676991 RepID=UPI0009EC4B9F|nr:N-acetylmuramoyl-L-alanine amidase [Clostridium sp. ATCC 25772]
MTTVSLKERCHLENKNNYDYFISFHRNAFKLEKARGAKTYIYLSASTKAKALAEKIQAGFVNIGVKTADYHVLRETRCPTVLIEIGFIDSTNDNILFDGKRNEIIIEIAKAILSQLGIIYKENKSNKAIAQQKQQATSEQTLYRVMGGCYTVRENAEKQVRRLKVLDFDATIMVCNR